MTIYPHEIGVAHPYSEVMQLCRTEVRCDHFVDSILLKKVVILMR